MAPIRRSADRRRRVLYQSHVSPLTPSTPATRQAAEQLRAARQPAQAFGSRVHRQLRGRWFSLVPVSRLSMTIVAAILLAIPVFLAVLHHLTLTWPSLAYRQGIARPLRIDRPDSFAAWWMTMVLVLSAGTMLLIYVLRRHRRDDYRGHYQLWRLTLIVLLFASIHSTVGLVAWMGAFMDLIVGDRAVLSGANWLRILLDVGGTILAMRLVAEVYRCRPALIFMVIAAGLLGLSEAAAWKVITVQSMARSSLVISAPMLACSCLLVSAALYLRSLYRQVRNIADEPSLRQRMTRWFAERSDRDHGEEIQLPESQFRPHRASDVADARPPRVAAATDVSAAEGSVSESANQETEETPESRPEPKAKKPGLFSRLSGRGRRSESDVTTPIQGKPARRESESASPDSQPSPQQPEAKRRWFGLRAAKPGGEEEAASAPRESEPEPTKTKKRGFSLRLRPQSSAAESVQLASDSAADSTVGQVEEQVSGEKKGWFGGLLRRTKAVAPETSDGDGDAVESQSATSKSAGPLAGRASGPLGAASRNRPATAPSSAANPSGADDSIGDEDDIDWESMSKAERRRMRKQLKRSGRAA